MRVSRDCWQCELEGCGHVWIAAGEEPPEQCARCKKRKWHTEGRFELAPGALAPQRELRTDAVATTGGKVTISTDVPRPNFADLARTVPGIKVAIQLDRPAHDVAGCRIYGCGMCAVLKGGK